MPTYHFNIHRADEVLIDDIGEDLADIQVAKNRAIEITCSLFQEFSPGEKAEEVAIEVQNEGRSVFRTLTTVSIQFIRASSPENDECENFQRLPACSHAAADKSQAIE